MRLLMSMTVLSLILGSCKKDAVTSACSFSGNDAGTYTQTDATDSVVRIVDAKDWNYDPNWNACENNLFSASDTLNYQNLKIIAVNMISAYPNPFKRNLALTANITGNAILKTVIVDQNFVTVDSFARGFDSGQHVWQYQFTQIDTTKTYRMYYRFYGANKSVIYQGHGDLRVTN